MFSRFKLPKRTTQCTERQQRKWKIQDGSILPDVDEKTRFQAPMHDSDEILTAIHMFSGSGFTIKLLSVERGVCRSVKPKMAEICRMQLGKTIYLSFHTR